MDTILNYESVSNNTDFCLGTGNDGVNYRADITARMVYTHEKKVLYGGVSYSPTNSVTAMIAVLSMV